jgi:hypothetical protein
MIVPHRLSARVGYRYRATFRTLPDAVRGDGLQVQWSPKVPRQLSCNEREDYEEARNRFIAEVAELMDGEILLIDHD